MKSFQSMHLVSFCVFLVAVTSRWAVLSSWWCLDDWGQLARAAGILSRETSFPARWLSQDLWWTLTWPLLGLNANGHTILRLILHGVGAVMVARLARQGSGQARVGLLAGVFFAATPIAFTVLYWASGIQELLAGVLVLAAVERWGFAGHRGQIWLTVLFGVGSIFAKESGFGLPILLALHLLWRGRAAFAGTWTQRWLAVVILLVAVGAESVAVLGSFATGPADPYRVGGPLVMLSNLGIFGWWLGTPGPVFVSRFTWTLAGTGGLLFVLWGIWGGYSWRQGRPLALTSLIAAVLSLGPALGLVQQTHPYLAYVAAAALSITLADLFPNRWLRANRLLVGSVVLVTGLGAFNTAHRLSALDENGRPADPIVRAATLVRRAAPVISSQASATPDAPPLQLILLQLPLRKEEVALAAARGDRHVTATAHYNALGGTLGPRLIAGAEAEVVWANSLLRAPPAARVLCETGRGFEAWGDTWHALLYATLFDAVMGHFDRARQELARAVTLNDQLELFIYESNRFAVSQQFLVQRLQAFRDWLDAPEDRGTEIAAPKLPVDELLAAVQRAGS
jgi:hypothetical protein